MAAGSGSTAGVLGAIANNMGGVLGSAALAYGIGGLKGLKNFAVGLGVSMTVDFLLDISRMAQQAGRQEELQFVEMGAGDPIHVRGVPADAVLYTAPDGQQFYAPPEADWAAIYEASTTNGVYKADGLDWDRGKSDIGHFGRFDFQRKIVDGEGWYFIHPYENASNFAVGIYMNGAGFSLSGTIVVGKGFAVMNSSNFNSDLQTIWWTNGWNYANANF